MCGDWRARSARHAVPVRRYCALARPSSSVRSLDRAAAGRRRHGASASRAPEARRARRALGSGEPPATAHRDGLGSWRRRCHLPRARRSIASVTGQFPQSTHLARRDRPARPCAETGGVGRARPRSPAPASSGARPVQGAGESVWRAAASRLAGHHGMDGARRLEQRGGARCERARPRAGRTARRGIGEQRRALAPPPRGTRGARSDRAASRCSRRGSRARHQQQARRHRIGAGAGAAACLSLDRPGRHHPSAPYLHAWLPRQALRRPRGLRQCVRPRHAVV